MSKIYFRKLQGGLFVPATQLDYELCKDMKVGDISGFERKAERNPAHHAKFWKLMEYVFAQQDQYTVMKSLYVEMKLKGGHYHEHITTKGRIIYIPISASFAE
ncbi:MAG: DUF1367 family protein, partial [Ghiorsea sp.]